MGVEIKYFDIDGNEIDHAPLTATAFVVPRRGERKLINNEKWRVVRSEVVYNRPDNTLIQTYCEKES